MAVETLSVGALVLWRSIVNLIVLLRKKFEFWFDPSPQRSLFGFTLPAGLASPAAIMIAIAFLAFPVIVIALRRVAHARRQESNMVAAAATVLKNVCPDARGSSHFFSRVLAGDLAGPVSCGQCCKRIEVSSTHVSYSSCRMPASDHNTRTHL